jgi:outer membrane protein
MKNIFRIILSVLLISVSIASFSQTTLKIGHIDIAKIMEAMPERDSAAAILAKETKEMQSTFDEMSVVYNKLLDDYQKAQSTLSDIVKKNKEAELLDKEKRLQEFDQNASTALQKRNSELIQPIIEKILKAVDKVAGENGFTYILDVSKGSVVYTSKESQNLNPLVLKVLKPL